MPVRAFLTDSIRYSTLLLCALGALLSLLWMALVGPGLGVTALFLLLAGLVGVGVYDLRQSRHAILRNYPILGHMRFALEFIRPEIRQYFIEGDVEAGEPFTRAQRSVVYQRAKGMPDVRPFGTKLDVGANGYEWINHSMQTTHIESHDFRIWIGGQPGVPREGVSPCTQPYNASVFNISAMSFGALSANAILALNLGARMDGFAHDTGEGGISRYHREHGGDLIWEIGSGYFGCRNEDGTFSPERFAQQAVDPQVKMIEIKISQGAKPGHGGMLPGAKVTPEIAAARGIPVGQDCVSPSAHSAFSTPVELMHFIARLRQLSGGKPVGFKLCIGHIWEWFAIVKAMLETDITPDYIVVDGAEGGTGAAPIEFADHMGAPVQEGLNLVSNTLIGVNLRHRIKIGAAGKVINSFDLARMFALGADWCNSGRGFMMALGCIQAQVCHTGFCPTGITTQDPLRERALVVADKAPRVAQYHANTLHALKELLQAAGLMHPDQLYTHHIVRRVDATHVRLLSAMMPTMRFGAILDDLEHQHNVYRLYWPLADARSFALHPPTAEDLAASPGIRPTIAGRPASAVQIAEELTRKRPPTPAPVSHLVPEQAKTFRTTTLSPSQVPPEWTGSGSDLLAAAMQLQGEHEHDVHGAAGDRHQ
ncbi:MAG TPA: FMN-binding glutamate synthase family protein [Ottowia sp.]|jgi:glutamate synthase domain-containing protein 2|nr:FMN-binding glutamate synthase family protein [Ottowia sp.]HMT57158.1 FMN-binding glutamate synthase family protein [Ottowia sp.]HMT65489.1 FMN-binding glutamate synthase family protein [Ottowia sp.]HMT83221.1 FMN-binding glutamate synthase family protein [Ottowia sp.]HOM19451.1 FMN-binding glutamate synthase family protein [Ottowia sp.]